MNTLERLLAAYEHDIKAKKVIRALMRTPDEYSLHKKLRNILKDQTNELIEEYLDVYEEYTYTKLGNQKSWKKDGKLHRDRKDAEGQTLPAVIFGANKEWWQNGKRHRTDKDAEGKTLPACIYGIRRSDWWQNGKKHREDIGDDGYLLPAVITPNQKQWYYNGVLHRDELDENGHHLPADCNGNTSIWYINGVKHREDVGDDGHMLPAVVSPYIQCWYYQGKRHREDIGDDGHVLPACIGPNELMWYKNGKLHRNENGQQLPAWIKGESKYWIVDGKLHRTDLDENQKVLPAIILGKIYCPDIYENGRILAALNKLKSFVNYKPYGKKIPVLQKELERDRDAVVQEGWFKNGKPHRADDAPAIIYLNGRREWWKNGKLLVIESNFLKLRAKNGKLHCDKLDDLGRTIPAVEMPAHRIWFKDGKIHRADLDENGHKLPAMILHEGRRQEWWQDGEKHRDDKIDGQTLPAVIFEDSAKEWWQNGKLHHDDKTMPATIYTDIQWWRFNDIKKRANIDAYGRNIAEILRTGSLKEWWFNGERSVLGNLPNVLYGDNTQIWKKGKNFHREDRDENGKLLPAVIYPDGTTKCYLLGRVIAAQ